MTPVQSSAFISTWYVLKPALDVCTLFRDVPFLFLNEI